MAGKSSEAADLAVSIASALGAAGARTAYEKLLLIREFENKVYDSFVAGLVQGTTHLCQGQEAVSVGTVMALRDDDYLTYTYRGHGPCVARGMDLEGAFAEIFGRSTGVSGGLGGSMHLTDMRLGLLGSFAIVGAGLPVAVGAGISARERGAGQVSMTWFGDGATNIGAFHESMNLAAVWKLPVIFVCENNLYGEYSPYRLFSQTKTTGSFHTAARFIDSWKAPMLVAPSPNQVMETCPVPRSRALMPAPTATGRPAPTMANEPSSPSRMSVRCIEPPRPPETPVLRPKISAKAPSRSMPRATQGPCPRYV